MRWTPLRHVVLVVVPSSLALAACHGSSPTTSPQEQAAAAFVASVRTEAAGIRGLNRYDDATLGGLGLGVCDFLNAGAGDYRAAERDLEQQHLVPAAIAPSIVGAALVNFCPSYIAADLHAGSS